MLDLKNQPSASDSATPESAIETITLSTNGHSNGAVSTSSKNGNSNNGHHDVIAVNGANTPQLMTYEGAPTEAKSKLSRIA